MKYASRLAVVVALAVAGFADAANEGVLEEVVVTAFKRSQNVLEVPVSVATKSGRELTAIFDGNADVRGLSTRVAGLYAESSNGRAAPRFYIRGLGNVDFDLAASQPVNIVMDDVVMENVVLKSFPLFDLEGVEVYRGPQGSVFGRNTTAGIVKLQSRKPGRENEAYVSASYGTYATSAVEGAVGGAVTDNVAGRLSFLWQHRDDWVSNEFTGQDDALGGFDERAVRGQLAFDDGRPLRLLLNAHLRALDGTASIFRANIFDSGSNRLNANYVRDTVFHDEGNNNPQSYDMWGMSLKADYDLHDTVTVTSITAFETAEGRSLGDIDGGYGAVFLGFMGPGFIPFPSQTQDSVDDLTQFTQELRIANDPTGRFDWQLGMYFFDSDLSIATMPFFVPPTTVRHRNQAVAVFGQINHDITERLAITAGLRLTSDDRDFSAPGHDVALKDEQPSGDVAVTFRPTEDATLYARYAVGFRAPSIQGRDVAFGSAPSTAASETARSFEAGVKHVFLDGRGQASLSVYRYEVEDMQFTAIGGAANRVQLVNAAEGVGQGLEIEGRLLIADNLEVAAGLGLADTVINDPGLRVAACGSGACTVLDQTDEDGFAIVDGNPFPNAPSFTGHVAVEYSRAVARGEVFAFADYAVQGDTNLYLYESREFRTQDQWELGAQIGFRSGSGGWEVSMFARNVTDNDNVTGAVDFNNLAGTVNEPRIIGMQFTSNFF